MPYTPIENFDPAQIPDATDEASFHDDATYVFAQLAAAIIPGINTNLAWLASALVGDTATILDSVAAIAADYLAGPAMLDVTDDLDNIADGFYRWDHRLPSNALFSYAICSQFSDGVQPIQMTWGNSAGRLAVRRNTSGVWGAWVEMWSAVSAPIATTGARGAVTKSTSAQNIAGVAADVFADVPGVKEMIDTFATVPSTVGAVGTYAYLSELGANLAQRVQGATLSGSSLRWSSENNTIAVTENAPSGTWQLMGRYYSGSGANDDPRAVWLRVS